MARQDSNQQEQVELFNRAAPYYDFAVKYLSFGIYSKLLNTAIKMMQIQPGERIIDICTGTGLNIKRMLKRVGKEGEIVGIDLSPGMLAVARKKYDKYPNVRLIECDITQLKTYENYFNKALLSFCIHEVDPQIRSQMIFRLYDLLKENGSVFIVDYNNIPPENHSWWGQKILNYLEHEAAFDYMRTDLEKYLKQHGFQIVRQRPFFRKMFLITQASKIRKN